MKNKRFYLVLIALAIMLIGIGISNVVAFRQTARNAENRAESVLLDSAKEQAATLKTVIDGQFRLLNTLAKHVALYSQTKQDEIMYTISALSGADGFSVMRYIDADGNMMLGKRRVDVSEQAYFTSAINGNSSVEYISFYPNKIPAIALSVPYVVDGNICGVICGWMYSNDVEKLIIPRAYGGAGYSLLVDADATVVAASGSQFRLAAESLSFLKDAELEGLQSYEEIMSKLRAGENFTFRYTYDGDSQIVSVAKLMDDRVPKNGWFVLNSVSDDYLREETNDERRNALEQIYLVLLFSVIAYALLVIYQRGIRKELAGFADSLRQREACFRAVADQTGRFVFRYDIVEDCYYQVTGTQNVFGTPAAIHNFCTVVLTMDVIAEESVPAAKAMMSAVRHGETPPDTDLRLKMKDGTYNWFRFYATPILDEHGNPESAVVAYNESGEQREREMAYSHWLQEIDVLADKSMLLLEWNITQNIFERQRGNVALSPYEYSGASFDEMAQIYAEHFVAIEDRRSYIAVVNRTHLLGLYHSSIVNAGLDYREMHEDGSCSWMRLTVRLVMYPTSTDVKAYIAVRDVNDEKLAELALIAQAEMDPLTAVYNRKAYIDRITGLFECEPEGQHLFIMLDVDEFKSVNDNLGHDVGDRLLKGFADTARSELRAHDIIGRTGGDEFMICISNLPSEEVMLRKAESLISAISRGVGAIYGTTVSMGIAVFPRDGINFNELYRKADVALYRVKRSGKNNFCFYTPEFDNGEAES